MSGRAESSAAPSPKCRGCGADLPTSAGTAAAGRPCGRCGLLERADDAGTIPATPPMAPPPVDRWVLEPKMRLERDGVLRPVMVRHRDGQMRPEMVSRQVRGSSGTPTRLEALEATRRRLDSLTASRRVLDALVALVLGVPGAVLSILVAAALDASVPVVYAVTALGLTILAFTWLRIRHHRKQSDPAHLGEVRQVTERLRQLEEPDETARPEGDAPSTGSIEPSAARHGSSPASFTGADRGRS